MSTVLSYPLTAFGSQICEPGGAVVASIRRGPRSAAIAAELVRMANAGQEVLAPTREQAEEGAALCERHCPHFDKVTNELKSELAQVREFFSIPVEEKSNEPT